jgi:hypothetical protein
MSKTGRRIRISGTPPMELWRQYPLWEYCVGEEGEPGQDEGTLKPSKAKQWRSRFDMSASFDLAMVFGEAELADGRVLPAELSFFGAPPMDPDAGPEVLHVYFAPPSIADQDRWTLSFRRVVGRWGVPSAPSSASSPEEAVKHSRSVEVPDFDLSNPKIFPLTVRTFAPRFAGKPFALVIGADGLAQEPERVSPTP